MKRPVDPRKHGLSKPQRVLHLEGERIFLKSQPDNYSNCNLSLQSIVNLWAVVWRDHESQGHRLISGPNLMIESGRAYLSYAYEWDNSTYEEECKAFERAVAKYEADVKAFELHQINLQRKDSEIEIQELDAKIERARERLANLLALKAGEPLPFTKESLDERRSREKRESRDQDAADLASSKKTQEDLRKENGLFVFPDGVPNFNKAKLY